MAAGIGRAGACAGNVSLRRSLDTRTHSHGQANQYATPGGPTITNEYPRTNPNPEANVNSRTTDRDQAPYSDCYPDPAH